MAPRGKPRVKAQKQHQFKGFKKQSGDEKKCDRNREKRHRDGAWRAEPENINLLDVLVAEKRLNCEEVVRSGMDVGPGRRGWTSWPRRRPVWRCGQGLG